MEGGDPNPDQSRSILHGHPASFTPDYSHSTTKSAGDVAQADFKAKGEAINAKAAEKAAEDAKVEAEQRANSEKKVQEDIAELKKA
jgi:cbb3-type cytochrome oxidase cytochrome c subunit